MKDPYKPFQTGCAPQDGYTHGTDLSIFFFHEPELTADPDAQCIVYRGPDKKYFGRDICYGYNEDTLTIYDVTNKNGPNAGKIISRTPYVGASYTHQGWVTDPMWQTHIIMDDELDEGEIDPNRTAPNSPAKGMHPLFFFFSFFFFLFRSPPQTSHADTQKYGFPASYVWDITSLEAPKNTGYYKSSTRSVDHNQFVHEGLAYQSNYQAGLRILDVSSIPKFPDASKVEEIAYFDVFPQDDGKKTIPSPLKTLSRLLTTITDLPGKGSAVWDSGTWSHFTFPSGYTMINTIDRGAFVVKPKFGRGKGKYWRKN